MTTNKKDLENRFGMTLLESHKKVPAKSLKFNRNYQRVTEVSRKEKVKKSINACGQFLPEKSLTINQHDEVVDGQHRLLAILDLGWEFVPITKYFFSDCKLEAAFFNYINGFDERLNSIDFWYSLYLSGDIIACLLYELEESPHSSLQNKITVKNKNTKKSKLVTGQALECVALSLGLNDNYQKNKHDSWVNKIEKIDRNVLFKKINNFIDWYEEIFGKKKDNPSAYRQDSFRAIKSFYILLRNYTFHNETNTIKKMKTFKTDVTFVTAPHVGKVYQLINHFNKNRKKEVLPYNIS